VIFKKNDKDGRINDGIQTWNGFEAVPVASASHTSDEKYSAI